MPLFYPLHVIHAILLVHFFDVPRKCVAVCNTSDGHVVGVLCVLWITSWIHRLIHKRVRHGCAPSINRLLTRRDSAIFCETTSGGLLHPGPAAICQA